MTIDCISKIASGVTSQGLTRKFGLEKTAGEAGSFSPEPGESGTLSHAAKACLKPETAGRHAVALRQTARLRHLFHSPLVDVRRKSYLPYQDIPRTETPRTNPITKKILGETKVTPARMEQVSYLKALEMMENGEPVHFLACAEWVRESYIPWPNEGWHTVRNLSQFGEMMEMVNQFVCPSAVANPPAREGKAILAHWQAQSRSAREGQRIQQPLEKVKGKLKPISFEAAAKRLEEEKPVYFQPMIQDELQEGGTFHRGSARKEGAGEAGDAGIALAPSKVRNYRELKDYYQIEESRIQRLY